jgi:conjugal transfer/entry exclusion protein
LSHGGELIMKISATAIAVAAFLVGMGIATAQAQTATHAANPAREFIPANRDEVENQITLVTKLP